MNKDLPRLTQEANNQAQHFAEKSWFVNSAQKDRNGGFTTLTLSSGSCDHALVFPPNHPDAQKALSLGPMDVVEFEHRKALPNLSINTCGYLRITNIWSN